MYGISGIVAARGPALNKEVDQATITTFENMVWHENPVLQHNRYSHLLVWGMDTASCSAIGCFPCLGFSESGRRATSHRRTQIRITCIDEMIKHAGLSKGLRAPGYRFVKGADTEPIPLPPTANKLRNAACYLCRWGDVEKRPGGTAPLFVVMNAVIFRSFFVPPDRNRHEFSGIIGDYAT